MANCVPAVIIHCTNLINFVLNLSAVKPCDRLPRLKASIAIILGSTFDHFIESQNTIMKIYMVRLGLKGNLENGFVHLNE